MSCPRGSSALALPAHDLSARMRRRHGGGADTGTPIISPGESAILALGTIRDMPWVIDGGIVPRKVCQLSLTFDHRVVDGQQGSQLLADVGAILADSAMAITY